MTSNRSAALRPIISRRARIEFRELIAGRVLREIDDEFAAADIECRLDHDPRVTGERRTRVEQYYAAVDWALWSDVRRVLDVYESVLVAFEQNIQHGTAVASAPEILARLITFLERDGFTYRDGRISRVGDHLHLSEVAEAAETMEAPELRRQIDRMRAAVDADPALAIGTAKELIESTCRTILQERGVDAPRDWDVNRLVGATRDALGLLPESIPDSVKGTSVIRKLLGQLGAVAQSIAEIRNLYGTGHGKEGRHRGIAPRHARLAVGAAATLATFLLETHEERNFEDA